MAYNPYPPNQPPYPPYGHPPPQGYPQPPYPQSFNGPPPPQGYYPPPPQGGQYNRPPPPAPPGGYAGGPPAPPHGYPQGPGYHAPSPQPPYGGPGYSPGPGAGPGPGPYGAPPGAPPAGGGHFGAPPPPHSPMPYGAPPSMPSLGYSPGQMAPGDFRREADLLRKAMKGFGTDEKTLIQVLSKQDPLQMAAIRSTYTQHIRRDLHRDVKSECGGYLRQGLLAVIDGPLMHDVTMVREALEGMGTKEWLLNDVLLGRSNADLDAIKTAYERTYHRSLQKDVEGDLSFKTLTLFTAVIRASRHDEAAPINPQLMQDEARTIHSATAARVVNNVEEVCGILARSSDHELRAINHAFSERYHTSLEKHIESQFSGHMKDALLYMLRTGLDPAMRDAVALEDCMKGMGTKDEKLVVRVVRVHWNRAHLDQVKKAYHYKFKTDLVARVRGETSGDYQRLMVALLE